MTEFIIGSLQKWSNFAAYGLTKFSYIIISVEKFYSPIKLYEQEESPKTSLWQSCL